MSIKKNLLAAAAVAALAFAALPAFASANPVLDVNGSPHFTVAGGVAILETASGSEVECKTSTGTGEFTNIVNGQSTTGDIQLTFHTCKEKTGNTNCTTPTQAAGTITTTALEFHLVTATDANGVKKDGVLITSNNGHFATFKCAFGLVHIEVRGNGIIGEITAPATGVNSPTFTLNFATTATGVQQYKTICGSATEWGLEASTNGGAFESATQVGEGTGTYTTGENKLTAG